MSINKGLWKVWTLRSFLVLLLIGGIWLTNLIWFRPFNIQHFYDRTFIKYVLKSPEIITQLGIPVLYDWTKDKWDDASDAQLWKNFQQTKEDYATLLTYDFERQTPANQLNTKILRTYMENLIDGEPYLYHNYPVNQLGGIQSALPGILTNNHKLKSKSDIRAYIARLEGFDTRFKQVLDGLILREQKGIIPPRFVIERVLKEMKEFIGVGVEKNILYTNFIKKVSEIEGLTKDEKSTFTRQVAEKINTSVFKAYERLIDYHEVLYMKATEDDGIWKLPDGDAYYRYLLKVNTTIGISPEEVYQIGLSEVNRIEKEMWTILRREGYTDTTKSIGLVMQGISKEERFLFPENDSGKAMVISGYKRIIEDANKRLETAFDIRPKASITVERLPEYKESGEAKGRYELPAMDGSKGGVFWINLREVAEHPKFSLKTLAYHEGVPGHHFQIGIQTELKKLPIFRTLPLFAVYEEGWALYAEQLAYEMGFYEDDPFGNLGRLQAEMWRACRLVIDAGIHYKKWKREEAIKYMIDHTGLSESEVVTEVERYIVLPAQACAYKIGMIKILELREKAKQVLGSKFDLREFHRVILMNGSVPMDILEENVGKYLSTNYSN